MARLEGEDGIAPDDGELLALRQDNSVLLATVADYKKQSDLVNEVQTTAQHGQQLGQANVSMQEHAAQLESVLQHNSEGALDTLTNQKSALPETAVQQKQQLAQADEIAEQQQQQVPETRDGRKTN